MWESMGFCLNPMGICGDSVGVQCEILFIKYPLYTKSCGLLYSTTYLNIFPNHDYYKSIQYLYVILLVYLQFFEICIFLIVLVNKFDEIL